jgi:hypothetical protein
MTENLSLWRAVERTPTEHTKAITGKSYSGTSPKPYYLVQKATETFGPVGIGWGFTIVDERIEDGAGGERLHIARVRVWYKWNGERGEVEHIGGTSFSGTRASGKAYTDEDAPKKSVTDALVKALSMIGFAGDIFMGRYDDSKYVGELKAEAAAEKRAATEPTRQQARVEAAPQHNTNPAFIVKGAKTVGQWVDLLASIANQAPDDATRQEIAAANGEALAKLKSANPTEYDRAMKVLGTYTQERTAA